MDYFIKYGEVKALEDAYNRGYDCGENRANTWNSNFKVFSTPEKTAAWEEGKRDAQDGKANKYQSPK